MLTVLEGDCRDKLRELADESVHCVVTSPPYWGLRDYGTAQWEGGRKDCEHRGGRLNADHQGNVGPRNSNGDAFRNSSRYVDQGEAYHSTCGKCGARRIDSQLGLEATPEAYIAEMVAVFREVRRVLRSDGTLWLNLGDSYANGGTGGYSDKSTLSGFTNPETKGRIMNATPIIRSTPVGLKPKDLCGIPWMLAFALRADGWYLRSEIIWHKPNPMPESVTDRPTKAHEQVFLMAKSRAYYYDAEAIKETAVVGFNGSSFTSAYDKATKPNLGNGDRTETTTRNRRTVWTIATAPYSDAHFATFPPKLVEPCVLAGTSARGCCAACGAPWERVVERVPATSKECPKTQQAHEARGGTGKPVGTVGKSGSGRIDGYSLTLGWYPSCSCANDEDGFDYGPVPCTILDPFAGSGTVGQVALQLGRRAVLIELNPDYCRMIERRNQVTLGLPGLA